ncbi:Transcription factor Sp5 [Geodia barretti]|uniref:Transcription factor Sp5 n=1 Tax=Geodia barretti TaxID=519541 RepID=A0AA35X3U5_GEOBA|nr:Transcription factor Sp5 [Geodia barretti]
MPPVAAAVGPSPWSAPPLPVAGSFTYPPGTSAAYRVVRPLSPISPSCLPPPPFSAPPNSLSHEPSAALTRLHHLDSFPSCPSGGGGTTVHAPTGTDFFDAALPAQQRRPRRFLCTCPNCASGANFKATKKQHVCHYPNCSKVYRKTTTLRAHILVHTGERPYICHWLDCGKGFTVNNQLRRHLKIHTGEKTFVCVECGKGFMRSDHLNKHTKTHQMCASGANSKATNPDGSPRKKQHVCHYPNCSKVYGRSSHLRAHYRCHTGERPYICIWLGCWKRFNRSDVIQRHFRTHMGEKTFVCVECGKGFMRSDHLNKHTKTHQMLREKEANSGSTAGGGTKCPDSLPPLDCEQQPEFNTSDADSTNLCAFPLEDDFFSDVPFN